MGKENSKAILMMVIASILWSTGGILIKLVDWHPVAIAGVRSGISSLVMIAYLKTWKMKLTRDKVIGGLLYASTVILFVTANKMTTAANVIVLQFSAPIWVALFSGWLLKERVSKLDWTAIGAVMLGMVLFFMGDLSGGELTGNVLSVISGIALAGVVLFLKRQKEGSPVEMILLGNMITFVVCMPFYFTSVPSGQSIVGLVLLGVFQLGIAYILFAEASKYVSAIEAILIPAIEPLLNPVWVLLFTGERPGINALFGGIIIISAVISRGVITARQVGKTAGQQQGEKTVVTAASKN